MKRVALKRALAEREASGLPFRVPGLQGRFTAGFGRHLHWAP